MIHLIKQDQETKTSTNPAYQLNRCESTTSDRYSHIETGRVISLLANHGLKVRSEVITKTRSDSRDGFQKHMIRLDSGVKEPNTPELIVVNSHDGFSSLKLMLGIYRMVCSNGLIMGQSIFPTIHIRHLGEPYKEIETAIPYIAAKFKEVGHIVDAWSQIELNPEQQLTFAMKAAMLRVNSYYTCDYNRILWARRCEDRKQDLWTVFNKIQEKVIGGGIKYTTQSLDENGHVTRSNKTTKKVKAINTLTRLNQNLSEIALDYVA